jgi:hypothetical protein
MMEPVVPKSEKKTETPEVCSLVVVYEDRITRDQAIALSNSLIRRFASDIEFEQSWWKVEFLSDPLISQAAGRAVHRSDVLIVSAHSARDWSDDFKGWLAGALEARPREPGALVALIGTVEDRKRGMSPRHNYLRSAAQQARLDYLAQVIDQPGRSIPNSPNAVRERATQITPVLDKIMHEPSR